MQLKNKKTSSSLFLSLIIAVALSFFGFALAYRIDDLNISNPEGQGDFVLGPGKIELWLDPGEEVTRELMITNRLGQDKRFEIEIEDFTGSSDLSSTVKLLGEEKGPYSLKDYLKPEIRSFTLKHGQRMVMPITISIPEDAEPGGLYGSVLVSAHPLEGEDSKSSEAQVKMISRVGSLFFVRVKGDITEEGRVKDFFSSQKIYEYGPIDFEILVENTGNIHLTPYGLVEIKNFLGKSVDKIELDAWFSMPDSIRSRKVSWQRKFMFGKYTATAKINRGYDNIIDEMTVTFWVFPWKVITALLFVIGLISWFLFWIAKNFEIKKKSLE